MPDCSFVELSLECACEGSAPAICSLYSLTLEGVATATANVTTSVFEVSSPGLTTITVSGNAGAYSIPMDIEYATAPITLTYFIDRSLLDFSTGRAGVSSSVLAIYACVGGDGVTFKRYRYDFGGGDECECSTSGERRSKAKLIAGQASGILYFSTPLGACNGCTVTVSTSLGLDPGITDDSHDEGWCLCPHGGTTCGDSLPVYLFSIVDGHLSSSQQLDPNTGCITGRPNSKRPSSAKVTFRVTDVRSGEVADAVCGLISATGNGDCHDPDLGLIENWAF